MKITINPFLSRMLAASGVIVPKLQSAIDSAYNQGTAVDTEASKGTSLTGAVANEKRGTFTARETTGTVRTGKLTDPLRFVAFNAALTAFYSKAGEPSGEITIDTLPANLRAWIDRTMRAPGKSKGKAKAKAKPAVALPAPVRGTTPAPEVSNGQHAGAK